MKVLLTGAHFTPAVAVIEQLKKMEPDVDLVYIGRKTTLEGDKAPSVESQVIPTLGVRFRTIITGRLQRRFTKFTIPSLLKIPVGVIQAFFIILSEKPDVVISFGGYVAVPLVVAAWLLSVPVIVHEQTLVIGLANRISSWFANKIAVSFPESELLNTKKVVYTGNPLRQEILNPASPSSEIKTFFAAAKKENKKTLLITGGNQGSHIINQTISESLPLLLKNYAVIHQTGDSHYQDYESLVDIKDRLGESARLYLPFKFIRQDMGYILKNIDVVVARAGINTLTELAYFHKPTVVIPLPYIYRDEQTTNARYFEKLGLVVTLLQSQLEPQSLLKSLKQALALDVTEKADQVVILDAGSRIALETLLLGRQSE